MQVCFPFCKEYGDAHYLYWDARAKKEREEWMERKGKRMEIAWQEGSMIQEEEQDPRAEEGGKTGGTRVASSQDEATFSNAEVAPSPDEATSSSALPPRRERGGSPPRDDQDPPSGP